MEIINGNNAVDDRGVVSFVNDFDFKDVKRFYAVRNHNKGFIRGWHGHKKEGKYVYVPLGLAQIITKNMKTGEIKKAVLSDIKPQVLFIPPGHYNAFRTETEDTVVMFFSTSTLEESLNDDIRDEMAIQEQELFRSKVR